MASGSPRASHKAKEKPSKVTKDRLAFLVEQEITECGKMARHVCQHSGSREALVKAAKKMASQEVAMENTLVNLRQIEKLLNNALEQANMVERSMERSAVVGEQIKSTLGQ